MRLESVFKKLAAAGLKLKPSKCFFFKEEIDYLGHLVSGKGEATSPMHNPISHNCAIIHVVQPHNHNSTELHQQGVAPRSQYSDHAPEVVTLQ